MFLLRTRERRRKMERGPEVPELPAPVGPDVPGLGGRGRGRGDQRRRPGPLPPAVTFGN